MPAVTKLYLIIKQAILTSLNELYKLFPAMLLEQYL